MSIPTPAPFMSAYPQTIRPVANVTPFTYRDGLSYLKILETLIDYVNDKLVGYIQLSMDDIVHQLNTSIEELSQQIAYNEVEYNKLLDDYMSSVEYRIMEINNKTGQLPIRRYQVTDDMVVDVEPVWPDRQQIILQFTQDYLGHNVEFKSTNVAPSPLPDATNGWTSTSSQWWPGRADINAGRRPDTNGYVTRRDISGPSSVISRIENIGGVNIPARHGREHTVSVYTHCTTTDDYTVQLHVSTDVENFDSPKLAATVDEQGWARTVYTFTMPTTTDVLNVSATVELVDGQSAGGEEVWWSDAQVELGDNASTYRGVFSNPHGVKVSRDPLITTQLSCDPQPDGSWLLDNLESIRVDIRELTKLAPHDVKLFGAKGDGITDDTNAIKSALRGGNVNVVFSPGNYVVRDYIRVFSNTYIDMGGATITNSNPNTEYVFVTGELFNSNYADGYNGEHDITIANGTIDSSPKVSRREQSQMITIGHATNVLIDNMTLKNNYRSHMIEINSSRNVHVRDCRFNNLVTPTPWSREFINIDYADSAGFPPFGSYDLTACDNVTVSGCTFSNGDDGVGSHSYNKSATHSRLKVVNNSFSALSGNAVSLRNGVNNVVSGNNFNEIIKSGITIEYNDNLTVEGNNFYNCGKSGLDGVIAAVNTDYSNFVGNLIDNDRVEPFNTYGIRIRNNNGKRTTGNVITGNNIINASTNDIYVSTYDDVIIDGVLNMQIAPKTTNLIFDGKRDKSGMLVMNVNSSSFWALAGLYRYRTGSGIAWIQDLTNKNTDSTVSNTMKTPGSLAADTIALCSTEDGLFIVSNRDGYFNVSFKEIGI